MRIYTKLLPYVAAHFALGGCRFAAAGQATSDIKIT